MAAKNPKIKVLELYWPQDKWDWAELPRHIFYGYANCTGDIAIKMDIDYLIHEKDFPFLRERLEFILKNGFVLGYFVKLNVINKAKGYQKVYVSNVINMKFRDQISFGVDRNNKTDWCVPIHKQGSTEDGIPFGIAVAEEHKASLGVDIYNYDYFFRIKERARERFWKFAQAYATRFDTSWGATEEDSWKVFIKQMKGRGLKPLMKDISHPQAIKSRIDRMTEEEYGYNNWSNFKGL